MPERGVNFSRNTTNHAVDAPAANFTSKIHDTTRDLHVRLNRLITSRLPLCLPPHAHSPLLYLLGIHRVGALYFAFENALNEISRNAITTIDPPLFAGGEAQYERSPNGLTRTQALRELYEYLPCLARSQRLRYDISALKRSLSVEMKLLGLFWEAGREEKAFTNHIWQHTSDKPQAILAYVWVMYMALFNGGRWMRTQFLQAGNDFWNSTESSPYIASLISADIQDKVFSEETFSGINHPYLSFWFFPGIKDGEDIREEFRTRFLVAVSCLTDEERDDVVNEAVTLFQRLTLVVEELDRECKFLGHTGKSMTGPVGTREFWFLVSLRIFHSLWTMIEALWAYIFGLKFW